MMKTAYSVLGVGQQATQQEIKQAYRKKAQQLHPDRDTGDHEAFQDLQWAYNILGHEDTRAYYDRSGQEPQRAPDHESVGIAIIAEHFGNWVNLVMENSYPANSDAIDYVRRKIEANVELGRSHVVSLENQRKKLEKISGKFTMADSENNMFNAHIQELITKANQMIDQNNLQIRAHDYARELLNDAVYSPEGGIQTAQSRQSAFYMKMETTYGEYP